VLRANVQYRWGTALVTHSLQPSLAPCDQVTKWGSASTRMSLHLSERTHWALACIYGAHFMRARPA